MKLINSLRRKGIRGSLNSAAGRLAAKYASALFDASAYNFVLSEDRPASLAARQSGPLRINWVLPGIVAGYGGFLNIFRTIQQLEKWGHENRVYILGNLPEGRVRVKENICARYFPIQAEVNSASGGMKDCDALLATAWSTAYAVRAVGNTAQKFYFVQDVEHMFYARGSEYEFARQTYQFGFRGITLGPWIAETLRREFGMECFSFGFSYDREGYGRSGARLAPSGKKRVLFYARPETERRGFELGVLALALVARQMPETELMLVGFPRRSIRLPFPATYLGILPISELGRLYRSCDAALVLSHTNLSMLPLELMACGCAVVSNTGPNVEWLLTPETAQLAKPDPASIADAIIQLLRSDELRLRNIEAGFALAESTDWSREIRVVEAALLNARPSVASHA